MQTKITAVPQLIDPMPANHPFVSHWEKVASSALRNKQGSSQLSVLSKNPVHTLYHLDKKTEGVYILVDSAEPLAPAFLYVWVKKGHTTEALAVLLNGDVRGVIKDVFFNHLLPSHKFVVTDSLYTPDGHRWFKAQYAHAFASGFKVFSIDHGVLKEIDRATFNQLQPIWWGSTELHQQYQFAIQHP